MQKLNQQPSEATRERQTAARYLQEMGHLLTQQVATPPSPSERLARVRFGQYIQSARQYQGLSRELLAAALGIEAAQVYGLEEGLLPTGQIGATLLPGLAHVLDEDPLFLNQLLHKKGDGRQGSAVTWPLPGWGRTLLTLCFAYCISFKEKLSAGLVRITDSCLQCGRDSNLVNRLQASRLTLYVMTALAALVLSFSTVRWVDLERPTMASFYIAGPVPSLGFWHAAPLVSTAAEQSHNITNYNLRGVEPASDAGLSRADAHAQPANPSNVTANYRTENYQIIYAPSQPSYKNAHAAYIAVDDAKIAIILLDVQVPPPPQTRCSTVGRFDLCPV